MTNDCSWSDLDDDNIITEDISIDSESSDKIYSLWYMVVMLKYLAVVEMYMMQCITIITETEDVVSKLEMGGWSP